jgi:hypothetical protein
MGMRYSWTVAAVIFCLIPFFGSAGMAQDRTEPNAADVYREAFKEMKPIPDDVWKKIGKTLMEDAERPADQDVSSLLESNAKALELARSASSMKFCRFLKADEKINAATPVPHLGQARQLAWLLVMCGLSVQAEKPMAALNNYLAARRLAAGVSQDCVILSGLVSVAIDGMTLKPIQRLFESSAPATVARVLLEKLPALSAGTASIEDTLDRDMLGMENNAELAIKALRKDASNLFGREGGELTKELYGLTDNEEVRATIDKNTTEVYKALVEEYYARIEKAVATHDFPALLALDKEAGEQCKLMGDTLLKANLAEIPKLKAEYAKAKGDPAKEKACAEKATQIAAGWIPKTLFLVLVPGVASAPCAMMRKSFGANALFLQACLVLAKKDKGEYPENLAALKAVSPLVTDKMLTDPFDGKPVRYARKGNGYVLYSIGKDCVDDKGEVPVDPQTDKGDIIFSAKN